MYALGVLLCVLAYFFVLLPIEKKARDSELMPIQKRIKQIEERKKLGPKRNQQIRQ